MPPGEHVDTTQLLQRMAVGDPQAAEDLLPLVYDELHRIADRLMSREPRGHTLQPTALIHEAFVKMVHVERADWQGRAHFMRVAARAMRSVLIDHARAAATHKRDGRRRAVTLHDDDACTVEDADRVLAVDEAVDALAAIDAQLAQIVELRFFGGFSHKEVAEQLGVSVRTVERGWQFARSWLKQHLAGASTSQ